MACIGCEQSRCNTYVTECEFQEQYLYNAVEGFSETSKCTRNYVTSYRAVTFFYRTPCPREISWATRSEQRTTGLQSISVDHSETSPPSELVLAAYLIRSLLLCTIYTNEIVS
jgi:hypothetical protein